MPFPPQNQGFIHPDLEEMKQRVLDLKPHFENNQMSLDEVYAAIENYAIIDASGARWTYNGHEFVRTVTGGTPMGADPSLFQPKQPPPPFQPPPPPPPFFGGAQQQQAPSMGGFSDGTGFDSSFGSDGGFSSPDFGDPFGSSDTGSGFDTMGDPFSQSFETPKPKKQLPKLSMPKLSLGGLTGKLNKRVVITIGVVIVVLVGISSVAKSSTVGQGKTTPASVPAQGPTVTSALPSGTVDQVVVSALESGNTTTASAVVQNSGTSQTQALNTATYYGYSKSGMTITWGPPTQTPKGILQTLQLNSKQGTALGSTTVTWVNVGGHWELQTWPSF